MAMKNVMRGRSVGGIIRSARRAAVCGITFDHQHTRVFRKGYELGLVHRKVLDANAMLIAAHVTDTVDQQRRLPEIGLLESPIWIRRKATPISWGPPALDRAPDSKLR